MSAPSKYQFDVVVIDATGESASQANALRRELGTRGLGVKLDVISNPDTSRGPVPRVAVDDAANAACTVMLMPWKEGGLGYMAIPAPSKRGATSMIEQYAGPATRREIESCVPDGIVAFGGRVVEVREAAVSAVAGPRGTPVDVGSARYPPKKDSPQEGQPMKRMVAVALACLALAACAPLPQRYGETPASGSYEHTSGSSPGPHSYGDTSHAPLLHVPQHGAVVEGEPDLQWARVERAKSYDVWLDGEPVLRRGVLPQQKQYGESPATMPRFHDEHVVRLQHELARSSAAARRSND